jgi:hypothetical protein
MKTKFANEVIMFEALLSLIMLFFLLQEAKICRFTIKNT